MYILNPPFLRQTPPPRTQFAVLLVLLCSALPLAASLPPVVMALFGGLWLLRLALLRLNISKIPLAAMLLLMVMAAVLVWQQLGTLFGREGGIAFLLLMVMLKAFEGNTRRDWQVLLLAMLFLAGAGVLLNQSLPVAFGSCSRSRRWAHAWRCWAGCRPCRRCGAALGLCCSRCL